MFAKKLNEYASLSLRRQLVVGGYTRESIMQTVLLISIRASSLQRDMHRHMGRLQGDLCLGGKDDNILNRDCTCCSQRVPSPSDGWM